MLYKYCPNCFSLSVKSIDEKNYRCERCKYVGEVKEDSIDKINLYRKQKMNDVKPTINQPSNKVTKNTDLISIKERFKNKFGENKSGDWELI